MKVTLVVKKSRYETADAGARRLLAEKDPSVSGWEAAHVRHRRTVDRVMSDLDRAGVLVTPVGDPYSSFDSSGADLVIVVGGDGTFLAASHSVLGAPMLGVNSDPESSLGFFCGATAETFDEELHQAMSGRSARAVIQRMEVSVDGAVMSRRVLNEALVCHPHPAATSRFSVNFGDNVWDRQVSSGAWVGPPAGTTGAVRSAGGDVLPLESRLIEYVAREAISGSLRKVVTANPVTMVVRTDLAAAYMDGPYRQAELRLGQTVSLRLSVEPLTVLGLDGRR